MGDGQVLEPLGFHEALNRLLLVIPTAVFHSEPALQQAVDEGQVPFEIRAVGYDNEHTSETPAIEHQDPGSVAGATL
jgi:hypothetical protein